MAFSKGAAIEEEGGGFVSSREKGSLQEILFIGNVAREKGCLGIGQSCDYELNYLQERE